MNVQAATSKRISTKAVTGLIVDAMAKVGVPPADAAKIAELMLEADLIGADSLAFISIEGLYLALGKQRDPARPHYCDACFTGDYPIPLIDHDAGKVSTQLSLLAETA